MGTTTCKKNWSDIPTDILYLIFEKLADNNINRLSNCAGVCVSWRSLRDQLVNKFSPTALITDQRWEYDRITRPIWEWHDIDSYYRQGHYRLFNTRTRTTQKLLFPQTQDSGRPFPAACWPGWIMTANCEYPHEISLLNQSTRAHITLPPPWDSQANFRVVPSSNPSDANCIFIGTYACEDTNIIGFCKQGDDKWTTTAIDHFKKCFGICDAVYYKGAFYVLGRHGNYYDRDYDHYMYRIQVNETTMTPTDKRLLFVPKLGGGAYYLVELTGKLLLITSSLISPGKRHMKAHKLQVNGNRTRWVRVRSLGGKHAIYARCFQSVSIFVGARRDYRPDCVYFIDRSMFDMSARCQTGDFMKCLRTAFGSAEKMYSRVFLYY